MSLPSSGPISIFDIKKEYNGDYPCPGTQDMKSYNDYPGTDEGAPNQFGYLNDYPSAKSQGFTDASIRCYIEKVYSMIPGKTIGPVMQQYLADPNFGPISPSSNSIPINEYYRNPDSSITNPSYVKSKIPGGNHPNTVNISTSGPIEFAQFRGSYSVIGFNRYLSTAYNFSLHFYTAAPNGEYLGDPNYYNLEPGGENYFYIHGGPVFSNSVPLRRYFKGSEAGGLGGPHLFTTSTGEGNYAQSIGFNYEGIVGYVYHSPGPNLSEIHRGTSNNGDFFYSTSKSEIDNAAGYQYDGVAFYAFTSTNWRA